MRRALLLRFAEVAFNSIPHAIFTVDDRCRITQFNRGAERITGWSADQVLGRPCADILRSESCARSCLLKDSMGGGDAHRDQSLPPKSKI